MHNYLQNRYLPGLEEYFRDTTGKVPYHIEDYLRNHFRIYNFAYGGISNTDIIYQFSNLPKYEPGDRIAVIWTSPLRFTIKDKDGQNFTFGDFNIPWFDDANSPYYVPPVIQDSITGKLKALIHGDAIFEHQEQKDFFNNEIRFIKYLKDININYKPVFMGWDPLLTEIVDIVDIGYGSSIYPTDKVKLSDECEFNDAHLGAKGNWYLYKYLHTKLEIKDTLLPLKYSSIDKIL